MTKAEERKILEQIVDLIQSTPTDSYIRSAFSGVPEYAVRNIDDDAAYNPVEERDMWEVRCKNITAELNQTKKDFSEYRASTEKVLDDMTEELTMWKNKYSDMCKSAEEWEQNAHDAGEMYCGLEEEIKTQNAEIIRLRAEIVRMKLERMTEFDLATMYEKVELRTEAN